MMIATRIDKLTRLQSDLVSPLLPRVDDGKQKAMGTRNLTAVILNGEFKVAQYGQWDGYPSGQGLTALGFLRDGMKPERFVERLKACRWITEEEYSRGLISAGANPDAEFISMEVGERFKKAFPYLDRDNGAKILNMIQDSTGEVLLRDSHEFASDSLFCEWAYVIDLDKRTFEVYRGFNNDPLPDGERFSSYPIREKSSDGTPYYPIKHVMTFSLDALPTDDKFLKTTEPEEEEAEPTHLH